MWSAFEFYFWGDFYNFANIFQNQFSLLQTEYISVTPPKDYFEQLIKLLLYNTPVGENFVATW